jgi:hypothetical protein
MNAPRRIILIGLIIVGVAFVSSDWKAAALSCLNGYEPDGHGKWMPPGSFSCGPDWSCPVGYTCGPNGGCVGGPQLTGPMCGAGRCRAGWLCGTAGGHRGCYDPSVTFLRGGKLCDRSPYPAGNPCARTDQNLATTPKRQPPEALKDAIADKPAAPRVLSRYMHGIEEVPALKVGNDWTCEGVQVGGKRSVRQQDSYHGYLCRPEGTIHCPFSSRSYACLPGYSCNNNPTGTGHSEEECRK